MDLLAVTVVTAVFAFIFLAGHNGSQVTESAFFGYFRGVRPDPWPRGVQEEDRSERWGAHGPVAAVQRVLGPEPEQEEVSGPPADVVTGRVHAVVGRTSPRS